MKLAVSNIAWSAEDDARVYALMRECGFSGLEIAPTRIFPAEPYSDLDRARTWAESLKRNEGFTVPSMQSIWFGKTERLFGAESERAALCEYTQKAIDFAAAVGCSNLVFGCPKNRSRPEGAPEDAALEFFKTVGDYAARRGTCVALEPNPTIYGTNYINTTAEALALIKRVASPGLRLNLDMGTIIANGEDIAPIAAECEHINHVHISEPGLKPVAPRDEHRALLSRLSAAGYRGWVSIEMGRQDGLAPLENAMRYLAALCGGLQ